MFYNINLTLLNKRVMLLILSPITLKNNLYQVVNAASLDDIVCLSGYGYMIMDNAQEYSTIKLFSILANHKFQEF